MIDTKDIIDRLFYDSVGQIFLSSLFGISLALLFNRVCKENCVLYYAPRPDEVNGKIFKIEDTCYKYKIKPTKCNERPLNEYDTNTRPDNKITEKTLFDKIFA